MATKTTADSSTPLEALRRDLMMVSPALATAELATPAPTPEMSEIEAVAQAIRQSKAPAIVGLNTLSIEACRHAVAAAEAMHGRLLPWPLATRGHADHPSVTQAGSLGHILDSQLIVWVGCTGADGPIAEMIARHQFLGAMVNADLETVLRVRRTLAADPTAQPIGRHQRVGVVLVPGVDPRVASQWHKLAAQVQTTTRMAVFSLPDLATAFNLRGALEVITWQTGLSCATGGVDFGDGAPRPCTDAQTLLDRGAIDLVLDTTMPTTTLSGNVAVHVAIRPEPPSTGSSQPGLRADRMMHVAIPALTIGTAARVMRCDGVILWICTDPRPRNGAPDSAALFFAGLTQALRRTP